MNAGGILGLMAGLGALSAMNKGGQGETGKRFTGLMDMLDGGGAGQSGDRFEGGGLLSALGNLFMKPIAAQDNVERIARETNAAKSAAKGGFTPPVTHQDPYMEEQKARLSPEDILMNMPTTSDKFGAQAAAEAGMGLSPFEAGPVDPSERDVEGAYNLLGNYKPDLLRGGVENIGELFGDYNYSTKDKLARVRNARGSSLPVDPSSGGLTSPALRQSQNAAALPQNLPQDPSGYNTGAFGGAVQSPIIGSFVDSLLKEGFTLDDFDEKSIQDLYETWVQNGGKFR